MQIEQNSVVTLHYTLKDNDGNIIDQSDDGSFLYLHGAMNIIPGLETAMSDKAPGDVFTAAVEPEQGYGLRDPNKAQRVPMKHLVFKGKLKAGDVVQLNTEQGTRAVTVTKAGRHVAEIDTNHPLAGQTLSFDIEIVEVRAASAEELSHGHAHGAGGHHHD